MKDNNRYYIQHYGRWGYIIVDSEKGLAVRKPGKEDVLTRAYDNEGKPVFLYYTAQKEAEAKCRELNDVK
jgi:hypothetical protein